MRNALLRHTMACLWAKEPPKLADLLPPDEDAAEQPNETEDERMKRKLDTIMAQFGGTMPTNKPEAKPVADDSFECKMWRLMGVAE